MEKRLNILRIDGLQELQERKPFNRKVQQKIVFIVYGNHVEEIEHAVELQTILTQNNYKSTSSSGKTPCEVFQTINDATEMSLHKVTVLVFPYLQTTPMLRNLIVYPLLEKPMCQVIMVKLPQLNDVPEYAKTLCTLDLTKGIQKQWPKLRKIIGRWAGETRAVVARVQSSENMRAFNNILDRLDLEISHSSFENQMYAKDLARKQLCITKSTRLISKVKRTHQCHVSNPTLSPRNKEVNMGPQIKARTQHTEIPMLDQTDENLSRTCTANLPYGKDAHVFIINGNSHEEKRLAKKMTTMFQLHDIVCISRDELQTEEDLLQAMMTSVERSVVTIILNFTTLSGISSIAADYAFNPDQFNKKAVVIPVIFSRKGQEEGKVESSSPNKTPLEIRRERQLDITTGQGVLMEDEDWQNKVLGYIQEVQRRKQLTIEPEQIHAEKCRIQQVVDDLQLVVKTPSYRAKKELYLTCLEKRPDLNRFLSSQKGDSVQSLPMTPEGVKQKPQRRPSSAPVTESQKDDNHQKRSQTPEPYPSRSPSPGGMHSSQSPNHDQKIWKIGKNFYSEKATPLSCTSAELLFQSFVI